MCTVGWSEAAMRQVSQAEFDTCVERHRRWLTQGGGGRRADFANCSLISLWLDECDLYGAVFSGARIENCEFKGCNFSYADFTDAQFDGIHFNFCDLTVTNFHRSRWLDCNLTTSQALSSSSFLVSGSKLANFRSATFTNITFVGEFDQLQFDGAKLDSVNAEAAHFSRCDFGHAVIGASRFSQASFTNCWFGKCSISDCDLSRAIVRGCNFEHGVLEKLALVEADLSENDLRQTRMADLCMARGRFMNLNNQELMNELDRAELDDVRYLGASFYFTVGPLPGRAEIEWSDDLEQNLWAVRC